MLTVRYHLKPDDIGAFGFSACLRSGQVRKGQTFMASLYVLGFFILGALVASTQSTFLRYVVSIVAFTLFGVLFATVTWQNYPRALRRNMMKVENPDVGRSMFGDFSLTVASDAFEVDHELTFSRTKWAAVRELVETPDHFFLMLSPVRGYVVPKAALSGATPQELADLLRQHLRRSSPQEVDGETGWSRP